MDSHEDSNHSYSQFACIGAGFSGIGLGATLKRWYGISDIRFFERHDQLGGTWYVNQYPGAACDVPSALYSYSFEPNPNWTRVLPSHDELWAYQRRVADKYGLIPNMTFGVVVQRCEWVESKKRWRLHVHNSKTDSVFTHECQFLFSGTGQLVQPRDLDVPGVDIFKGAIFHSSRWRHDVDLTGKRVVVIGNGCTGAQIMPSIVGKTAHLTQIVRSKHWILPAIDGKRTDAMRMLFKYIPGSMALQRLVVFLVAENDLRGFPMTKSGARFRRKKREGAERYMRAAAPEKYHDLLIPDFEVGCKRRIFDSGYLACLHAENLTLTGDQAVEVTPEGVRTEKGFIEADVIVLANGFVTNSFLGDVEVKGRTETLAQHWEKFGGAEAYNCSAMSGFPNFFLLFGASIPTLSGTNQGLTRCARQLGPNAATGHTSAIMAAENSINYALRVIQPVLDGKASAVDLRLEAEQRYVDQIQDDLQKTVWNSGCQSWYVEENEQGRKWNAMSYPYSQAYYWYRSLFPVWRDWEFYVSQVGQASQTGQRRDANSSLGADDTQAIESLPQGFKSGIL